MNMIPHDLRLGARMLAKRPATTMLAVVTLAIGIGANTAAFSLLSFFLLHPLPFQAPDRIVAISEIDRETGTETGVSMPDLDDAAATGAFTSMAAVRTNAFLVEAGPEPEQVQGAEVSPEIGAVLGVEPLRGRLFSAEDATSEGSVAVLGNGYWQRRFGADPTVVGRTIVVDRRSVTIVGVLPVGVQYPARRADIWIARRFDTLARGDRSVNAVARLADGVSLDDARLRLEAVSARLADAFPDTNAHLALQTDRLDELAVGKVRQRMALLQIIVLFILLIACANVASLRLALASARSREVAIRAAIGAARSRIARQFLVESLLLAVIGGSLGVVVARSLLRVLVASAPDRVVGLDAVTIDARVLLFALAVSLGAGLVFGLIPALRASRIDPAEVLRSGSGASAMSFGRDRARSGLLIFEVALTVVLLVGTGLVMRAYWRIENVPPGFDASNGVAVDVDVPEVLAPDDESVARFYRDALARARAVPGVESAGAVDIMPLVGWNPGTAYVLEGDAGSDTRRRADLQPVTAGYFRAIGMPILSGRSFDDDELEHRDSVAIVNELFARTAWPERSAIGERLLLSPGASREGGRWLTVVGIVGNVHQFGVQLDARPEIYVPATRRSMTIVARVSGSPDELAPTIAAAIRSAEPGLPRLPARTLESVVSDALAVKRLSAMIIGVLCAAAVLLASVGLFGIVSHAVTRRTREIGVRMALGARTSDVAGLIVRQCVALAGTGLVAGLVGSLGLTRALQAYLFGMSPLDPVSFAGASVVLLLVVIVAAWVPVRRAMRIDPMEALRTE